MQDFNREISVVPFAMDSEYSIYESMDLAYYAEMHEKFRFQLPNSWFQDFGV